MSLDTSQFNHILLVDDNPTNLKVLSEALQGQGWKTLMATDGEAAIEQAEYARPALILLDVMMPGIDGFETCQQLKANPATQDIPIIFMTALSEATNKVKGLELGAVDYITKPFQQEEVIARIKLHLKLSYLTQTLEQQVEDRTAALTESLQKLQKAQLRLIQSEKMSTLGQLVAGIGHEINNPIGFIEGNLDHLERYIKDLFELLTLYQEKVTEPDPEIMETIEDIDLEYLVEDLPNLIQSMQEGTDRLRHISLSLRTFARADTTLKKVEFQVDEGIDSTLLLLKHRMKVSEHRPEIEVIRHYGEIPPIECYPGQINQVFMNILVNALDALEDFHDHPDGTVEKRQPTITISTELDTSGTHIIIRIKDNGSGMPTDVLSQIFESSFTTKPVGKGTGLGLPISREIIVEKHKGQITCSSELGLGTEFIITLPVE